MFSDMHAWIPVFFLYFSQQVSLQDIITLSAIYYFAVCFLEVPCGLASDRLGRRITLVASAFSAICAFSVFLIGGSFFILAAGQILMALAIALQSGTDTAMHYDSLKNLNLDGEYLGREAHAEKLGLLALAVSTLAGGVLAIYDLRWAYVLSLLGAIATFIVTLQFKEPNAVDGQNKEPVGQSIVKCFLYLRQPVLCWMFLVMTLMYCLEHFTYEFYQPYISLLVASGADLPELFRDQSSAPLLSGIIISISMFSGSLGAAISVRFYKLLGIFWLLILALVIQLSILAGMYSILALVTLLPVMMRNFPMALIHAPVNAEIAPRVETQHRATYLSIQSLAQRLVMSGMLIFLSVGVDQNQALTWPVLQGILGKALIFGATCLILALGFKKVFKSSTVE